MDRCSPGLIIYTSAECRVMGTAFPGIPTIIWDNGIDIFPSDWLRHIVIKEGVALSTAKEYAKILRFFLTFCRSRRRSWQSVDDEFLTLWRENMRHGRRSKPERINVSLNTIFSFYRWAEETKVLRYRVGVYVPADLPVDLQDFEFPISAKLKIVKASNGQSYHTWSTRLTIREGETGAGRRHTPTEAEVRRLHEVTVERLNGERNSLLFSWAEEAGPRRSEVLRLVKSQLPSIEDFVNLAEADEPWIIKLKRKGGAYKSINVPLELAMRTMEYVEFERRQVVDDCLKTFIGYQEPDEVFLSSKTGLPLHPDSLTSISRTFFKLAGIERSSFHRLRAKFSVTSLEALLDATFAEHQISPTSSWHETILTKLSDMMGHSSASSLRPYLTTALNRRIQTADAMKAMKTEARLRLLEHRERAALRRMKQQGHLAVAARHLAAGDNKAAALELQRVITLM